MAITGATRLLAIIGDPIYQARNRALINPRAHSAGMNTVLVPMHIPAAEFDAVLPGLMALGNLDGLVVAYHFKNRAMAYCQYLTNRAQQIGGLNVMRRDADGQRIGAGGALVAPTEVDIDAERANNLVNCVGTHYPGCEVSRGTGRGEGHDIIINATTIGMTAGDGMPADFGPLTAKMSIADTVPVDEPTAIMRAALAAGANVVPRKAMIEGQAEALLEVFGFLALPAAAEPPARGTRLQHYGRRPERRAA